MNTRACVCLNASSSWIIAELKANLWRWLYSFSDMRQKERLHFPHKKKKRGESEKDTKRKGRCGFLCQTTQRKIPRLTSYNTSYSNDDQKLFSPSFLKGKSVLRYNSYILFLLISNSLISGHGHERLSRRARQLTPVWTHNVYFSLKWPGQKWVFTGEEKFWNWQCVSSSTTALTWSFWNDYFHLLPAVLCFL